MSIYLVSVPTYFRRHENASRIVEADSPEEAKQKAFELVQQDISSEKVPERNSITTDPSWDTCTIKDEPTPDLRKSIEVANYLLQNHENLWHTKLQKILVIAQGIHAHKHGEPLFHDPVTSNYWGSPVIKQVRYYYDIYAEQPKNLHDQFMYDTHRLTGPISDHRLQDMSITKTLDHVMQAILAIPEEDKQQIRYTGKGTFPSKEVGDIYTLSEIQKVITDAYPEMLT